MQRTRRAVAQHPTGRTVYRPVVDVTLLGGDEAEDATFMALVDSGCERILAAPGVARQIGVSLTLTTRFH